MSSVSGAILSGTLNRQSFVSCLEEGFHKARISKKLFSAIVLDLNQFKSINDIFSYSAGNFVLKETVKVAQSAIRGDDFVGRFGEDEFMAVPWDTSLANACIVADKTRSKIEEHNFTYEGKKIPVTVSLGGSSLDDSIRSIGKFFVRADETQHTAKKNGGNQVSTRSLFGKQSRSDLKRHYGKSTLAHSLTLNLSIHAIGACAL